MAKEAKTNAMRLLDRQKIRYEAITYDCPEFIDGLHTAKLTGAPVDQSYKTILTHGKSGQYYVLVIPIAEEIDLKKAARTAGEKSLEMVHVKDLLSLKVKTFSGGMKRRLSIACAVAQNQPVLILDEPTSSLDLHQKKIISDYILQYTGEGGIVLISTHDKEEILLCTQVYYLEEGTAVPVTAEEAIGRLRQGMG